MSRNGLRDELLGLSASERLDLVEALWDSLPEDDPVMAMTPNQRDDLDRRIAEADADPEAGAPWDTARERIRRPSR